MMMNATISGEQLATLEPLPAEPDVHILAGIDDDVTQDLAAIGITLTPGVEQTLAPDHRQAMAARLFRRIRAIRHEIAETERTMRLELDMVTAHYERQLAGPRRTVALLLGFIETLAELTPWGKVRSFKTPHGTYGVRAKPSKVEQQDGAALLAWAATTRPEFVRFVGKIPLAVARERFTDDELQSFGAFEVEWGKLAKTLDPKRPDPLPPGVALVAGVELPYATPAED